MTHKRKFRITRDTVLLIAGLLGIANETLLREDERATLLLLFAAMIGLPAFLQHGDQQAAEADKTEAEVGEDLP